ncbi:MAG: hypothetical protein ITG02_00820 [Patulibacter sp.]|nr:hypothetical protein [Patulibacter sp.]
MSYAALIERFDRHMDRIDEELRLSREAAERHAAMFDDTREFIREMTLRMHRDSDAMISTLNEHTEAFRAEMLEHRAERRDDRAQIQANTAAVLKMLDRMDGS